jgi:hypothetical protein
VSALPPLAELADALRPHAAHIAEQLIGTRPSSRSGSRLRFRRKGSFAVAITGPDRGAFYDYEVGLRGDPLDMIAHLRGTSLADAASWARSFLGL